MTIEFWQFLLVLFLCCMGSAAIAYGAGRINGSNDGLYQHDYDVVDDFTRLQQEVGEFGEKTFPMSTTWSVLKHFEKEAKELIYGDAEKRELPGQLEEAVDCMLLLLHLSYKNHWDMLAACREKLEINRQRKWGEPDADGVVEHIRETVSGAMVEATRRETAIPTVICGDCGQELPIYEAESHREHHIDHANNLGAQRANKD